MYKVALDKSRARRRCIVIDRLTHRATMHAYPSWRCCTRRAPTSALPPMTSRCNTTPHILTSARSSDARKGGDRGRSSSPRLVRQAPSGAGAPTSGHHKGIVRWTYEATATPLGPRVPEHGFGRLATLESLKSRILPRRALQSGKVAMACALRAPALVKELCVLDGASILQTADGSTGRKRELIGALAI